jgi:imidazoleglycerol-phosphate dehydratase
MRNAEVSRTTKETAITVRLELDGTGQGDIATGIGFFDHMLDALIRHGLFDATIKAQGDLEVDGHHTVEDVGIVLGQAFGRAIGDKAGIRRFGTAVVPMDEALVMASVDISGRGQAYYDVPVDRERVGGFETELAQEFFIAFAREAGVTLHVRKLEGSNAHHIIEAAFKSCARALRQACEDDPRVTGIPSTKGAL